MQWLGLSAFTAVGLGLVPGWETKIPQATKHGQKKKKRKETTFPLKCKSLESTEILEMKIKITYNPM